MKIELEVCNMFKVETLPDQSTISETPTREKPDNFEGEINPVRRDSLKQYLTRENLTIFWQYSF